jgi:hypothetical protein
MSETADSRRPAISESPWFWLYLFATAALIALLLMGPKFAARQAQIEREGQGRHRAAQQTHGQQPSTPLSTTGSTIVSLGPLYLVIGGLLIVAWSVLWWQHFRPRPAGNGTAQHGASQ